MYRQYDRGARAIRQRMSRARINTCMIACPVLHLHFVQQYYRGARTIRQRMSRARIHTCMVACPALHFYGFFGGVRSCVRCGAVRGASATASRRTLGRLVRECSPALQSVLCRGETLCGTHLRRAQVAVEVERYTDTTDVCMCAGVSSAQKYRT